MYPSWTPGEANLFPGLQNFSNEENSSEGTEAFSDLLDVSDSVTLTDKLELDTKKNGEVNGLVEFMDSQESEATKVQKEQTEPTVNPLLVLPNKINDIAPNPLMEDLDKMRMHFFMQDNPVFEGNKALRQDVVTRYVDQDQSITKVALPLELKPQETQFFNNELSPEIINSIQSQKLNSNNEIGKIDFSEGNQKLPAAELDQVRLPGQVEMESFKKETSFNHPLGSNINSLQQELKASFAQGGDLNIEKAAQDMEAEAISIAALSGGKEDDQANLSDNSSMNEDPSAQLSDGFPVLREMEKSHSTHKFSGLMKEAEATPLSPQNLNHIKESTQLIVEKGGGTAKIKLYPEGLGELEIQVKVTGNQVSVNFIAENEEVKQLFESSIKQLGSQFKEHNLQLDQMVVQLADSKNSSSFDSRQGGGQPNVDLLRDMMNQSRQESFGRQTNTYQDFDGIRTYGRQQNPVDPIRPASALSTSARYQGQGRGGRLSLVG